MLLREKVIYPSALRSGFNCTFIDPRDYGRDDKRVFEIIAHADAMVVDTSERSSDYTHSIGVRHALTDKPTFLFAETGDRPFDIFIFSGDKRRGVHYIDFDDENSLVEAEEWLTTGLHQALVYHPSYSPVRMALEDAPRVFLSYAHTDRETVAAVDQWLRDRGARADIDERELIAGRDIRDEILRLINRAGKVVCFYSAGSSDRYYTNLERRLTEEAERLSQERGAKRVLLIYFRLDDTPLPPESTHRLAINAWIMGFEEACEELWRHLLERAAEPRRVSLAAYRFRAPWAKS